MKLVKIVDARQVLEGLSEKDNISAHLAYWMAKFVSRTKEEHTFYVREMQKLFNSFATKKPDGTVLIPNEKVDEFNKAVEALDETDVEDPGIRFNLSELSSELKLSMKQIFPLLDFIDENK